MIDFNDPKLIEFVKQAPFSEVVKKYQELKKQQTDSTLGSPDLPGQVGYNLDYLTSSASFLLEREPLGAMDAFEKCIGGHTQGIKWVGPGHYFFILRDIAQYEALCEFAMTKNFQGMWPILTFDLLQPLNSDSL